MRRSSRRMVVVVCLAVLALSLMVGGRAGFTEEPPAVPKPEKIVATDYPNLHEAIEAAKRLDVYHIYIPSGIYYIDKTLDLSGLSWSPVPEKPEYGNGAIARNKTVIFEGAGRTTILVARTGDTPAIDLTGSHPYMILKNFVLETPCDTDYKWLKGSAVGIFMARMGPGRYPEQNPASSGDHYFENVTVQGAFETACVVSYDSEVNRFVHCTFSNTIADAFIFTDFNREGVKSPNQVLGESTNTEQRFYGTNFGARGDGAVALRICGVSDVSVHGGCFSTGGNAFAAVYLDGTGHVAQFTIRDVRMECSGAHCIYAVGAVSNVVLEGGEYGSIRGENIRHEERIPSKEGPHRFVAFPEASGRAQNWNVRNVRLAKWFGSDPAKSSPGARIRFDALQDSRFTNINFDVRRNKSGEMETDLPLIVVEKYSRRNSFEVPSREAVELGGDAKANTIVALCDDSEDKVPALWMSGWTDVVNEEMGWVAERRQKFYDNGMRRTYVMPDAGQSLLNLGMTNVLEIARPRKGDFALHDGTGFEDKAPRLAVYDGKQWLFFSLERPPAGLKEAK